MIVSMIVGGMLLLNDDWKPISWKVLSEKGSMCKQGVKPERYSLTTPKRQEDGTKKSQLATIHQTLRITFCYDPRQQKRYIHELVLRDPRNGGMLISVPKNQIVMSKASRFRHKYTAKHFELEAYVPNYGFLRLQAQSQNLLSWTVVDEKGMMKRPPIVGSMRRTDWIVRGQCDQKAVRGVRHITAGKTFFRLFYCEQENSDGHLKQRILQTMISDHGVPGTQKPLEWNSLAEEGIVKMTHYQGYQQLCDQLLFITPKAQYRVLTGRWVSGCVSETQLSWPDPIFGGGFDVPVKVRYAGQPWRLSYGQDAKVVSLP